MSDDILVLPEGNIDANNFELHDVPKEQASLADMRITREDLASLPPCRQDASGTMHGRVRAVSLHGESGIARA